MALPAENLRPLGEQAAVNPGIEPVFVDRLVETRPARARIKLRLGIEQGYAATHANVKPDAVVIPVLSRECGFSSPFACDTILFGREPSPLYSASRSSTGEGRGFGSIGTGALPWGAGRRRNRRPRRNDARDRRYEKADGSDSEQGRSGVEHETVH